MRLYCGVYPQTSYIDSTSDGLIFDFDLTQWIDQNLYFLDDYERDEAEWVKSNILENSIFFDIGANIGIYSLFVSKVCNRVYAFEPEPKNFSRLKKNIVLNKVKNITTLPWAVTGKEGWITLYVPKSNRGRTSEFPLEDRSNEIKTKCITVDNFIKSEKIKNVSFIKMDIEGGEPAALSGLARTIEKFHPLFLIEVHRERLIRAGSNISAVYNFFSKRIYHPYQIEGGKLVPMRKQDFLLIDQKNIVFR